MTQLEKMMLSALYTALNAEMAAHIGAQSAPEVCKGFDVRYHFNKVREAILAADPKLIHAGD